MNSNAYWEYRHRHQFHHLMYVYYLSTHNNKSSMMDIVLLTPFTVTVIKSQDHCLPATKTQSGESDSEHIAAFIFSYPVFKAPNKWQNNDRSFLSKSGVRCLEIGNWVSGFFFASYSVWKYHGWNRRDLTSVMLQIKPSNTLRALQPLCNCMKKREANPPDHRIVGQKWNQMLLFF